MEHNNFVARWQEFVQTGNSFSRSTIRTEIENEFNQTNRRCSLDAPPLPSPNPTSRPGKRAAEDRLQVVRVGSLSKPFSIPSLQLILDNIPVAVAIQNATRRLLRSPLPQPGFSDSKAKGSWGRPVLRTFIALSLGNCLFTDVFFLPLSSYSTKAPTVAASEAVCE